LFIWVPQQGVKKPVQTHQTIHLTRYFRRIEPRFWVHHSSWPATF